MLQNFNEWILLFLRWLHIIVGVAWIGASFFFMWLDRSFLRNPKAQSEGHLGELWMVHGGGFYFVEKRQMGAVAVPQDLHWFKWESYWTWISGMALLVLTYYSSGGTFLLDSAVADISFKEGIAIGLITLLLSWFFYDLLWESIIAIKWAWSAHLMTLLWLIWISYFLCHIFSGRAAYIHVGAILGTWMAGNVFLRIIPRQVKMVEAAKQNKTVNPQWSKNAKSRSTHNTYFTLPVIFIMVSNHFPSTYGHQMNWLILLLIGVGGAAIREYFVMRLQRPLRAKLFGLLGVLVLVATSVLSGEETPRVMVDPPPIIESVEREIGLRGVVKIDGSVPSPKEIVLPPGCGAKTVLANDVLVKEGRVENVFVQLRGVGTTQKFIEVPSKAVVMDQRECMYRPRVAAVRVGQRVEFINSDAIFHNVRTFSEQNESFNINMPSQNDRATRVFVKPEIFLQTKCSLHPWMGAYIAVVDHPFYSVTDSKGEFAIPRPTPGDYEIELWHEVFGILKKKITVGEGENLHLEFTYRGSK